MEILSTEIQNSPAFNLVHENKDTVMDQICKSYYITSMDKLKLLTLYCTVKMHKEPISFRFITAGRNTVLQNLSIAVANALNHYSVQLL